MYVIAHNKIKPLLSKEISRDVIQEFSKKYIGHFRAKVFIYISKYLSNNWSNGAHSVPKETMAMKSNTIFFLVFNLQVSVTADIKYIFL